MLVAITYQVDEIGRILCFSCAYNLLKERPHKIKTITAIGHLTDLHDTVCGICDEALPYTNLPVGENHGL